uniref:5-hydroxytryptamine receptor 2C n=1 Tax=Astyanax mexicanus TaxID=7994 RepID=A0A3B1JCZ1_ASTMX
WPALIILVFIFFTVGGNILVILAVSLEKKLQNATNFFLRSLAVADMLVGVLVMPASLLNILNYSWPLPQVLCPMWIFLDVLFSTASIMHLCAISLDRYIGIRNPIQHSRSNSSCRAMAKITVVWTISMVSLPIPVIGLQDEQKVFVNGTCQLNEPHFVLVGSFVAFFVPLLIMVVCYCLTVKVLQQHTAAFSQDRGSYVNVNPKQPSPQPSVSGISLLNEEPSTNQSKGAAQPLSLSPLTGHEGPPQRGQGRRGMTQAIKNERRASKVLGVVFFLFLVMWCPFFITNVVVAVCQNNCSNLFRLLEVFVWVGYVSSGVNPLVYTLFNKTYRHAFSRHLQCRYH